MFDVVGIGTHEVLDGVGIGVVDGFMVLVPGEQVYTDVERLGDGALYPEGGYLDLHPEGEQSFPGQEVLQY